jgi:hypothetical protein
MAEPDELSLRKAVRLDRYAEILAHVLHFGAEHTAEVVARFGLPIERWWALDRAWMDALATSANQTPREATLRFSATLHACRLRLAQKQPPLASIGDARAQAPVAAAPPAPPRPRVELPTFMLEQQAAYPPPPPPPAPPQAFVPPPQRPLDSTWGAVSLPAGTMSPLPFVEGTAAPTALQHAVEHAGAVQGPKPARSLPLGGTVPVGEGITSPVLPFSGPPPELTLEQRASLHVELRLQPERRLQILHRYGLTPEQHERAAAAWEARLAREPNLQDEWEHAVVQYRIWRISQTRR